MNFKILDLFWMALLGFIGRIPDNGVTGIANGLAVGLFVVLDSFMVESGGFLEVSEPDGRVELVLTMVECFA
eukprot:6215917-Ditylum_brightwellii.AAC.1